MIKFLREAGRVLSLKNEKRIRTASQELEGVLQELGAMSEAERSLNQKLEVLQAALSQFGEYVYLMDVFDSELVYCVHGEEMESPRELYKVPFSLDDNDVVTFGDPIPVVRRVSYEPISQAVESLVSDVCPLVESASASGAATIKIIQPGWGSSGYYSAEVLRRDGPRIFPAGTHMYLDHASESERRERPEGSVRKLAAVTTSPARWLESGTEGQGLYADVRVGREYKTMLADFKNDIGVSIVASGTYEMGEAEGRKGRIIKSLSFGESIDFVTRAGAGGKIIELMEAQKVTTDIVEADIMETEKDQKIRALEAQLLEREIDSVVRAIVENERGLIDTTKRRLIERGKQVVKVENGAIDLGATSNNLAQMIEEEKAYIQSVQVKAQIAESQTVRNLGQTTSQDQAAKIDALINSLRGK